MILVTGATGTIGSEVTRQLREREAPVRAMTRDPVRWRGPRGVEVVTADLDRPDTLGAAVAGTDTVFLATAPGAGVPAHDLALLAAAREAGVRRVVKLSAIRPDEADVTADVTADGEATAPGDWHEPGERALLAGGPAATILRPAGFASNALAWAEAVRTGMPVPNPWGDGGQAVIDPADVAAVAVVALLAAADDPTYDGAILTLTGPEVLSLPEQVAVVAAAVGTDVGTVEVSAAEQAAGLRASGADEELVAVATRGSELVRSGRAATRTPTVADVLGRPARTFAAWVADHVAAFRP